MDWADLVSMIDNRELQAKIDQAEKPPKGHYPLFYQ
jgi:hypothetical protein